MIDQSKLHENVEIKLGIIHLKLSAWNDDLDNYRSITQNQAEVSVLTETIVLIDEMLDKIESQFYVYHNLHKNNI